MISIDIMATMTFIPDHLFTPGFATALETKTSSNSHALTFGNIWRDHSPHLALPTQAYHHPIPSVPLSPHTTSESALARAKTLHNLTKALHRQSVIIWVLVTLLVIAVISNCILSRLWIRIHRQLRRAAARSRSGQVTAGAGFGRRDGIVDRIKKHETSSGKFETWTPRRRRGFSNGGMPRSWKPAFVNGRFGFREI